MPDKLQILFPHRLVRVYGTTNAVYGTTNADAGVGGSRFKRGIQEFD